MPVMTTTSGRAVAENSTSGIRSPGSVTPRYSRTGVPRTTKKSPRKSGILRRKIGSSSRPRRSKRIPLTTKKMGIRKPNPTASNLDRSSSSVGPRLPRRTMIPAVKAPMRTSRPREEATQRSRMMSSTAMRTGSWLLVYRCFWSTSTMRGERGRMASHVAPTANSTKASSSNVTLPGAAVPSNSAMAMMGPNSPTVPMARAWTPNGEPIIPSSFHIGSRIPRAVGQGQTGGQAVEDATGGLAGVAEPEPQPERDAPAQDRQLDRPPLHPLEIQFVARGGHQKREPEGRERADDPGGVGDVEHRGPHHDPRQKFEHDDVEPGLWEALDDEHGHHGDEGDDGQRSEVLGAHRSFSLLPRALLGVDRVPGVGVAPDGVAALPSPDRPPARWVSCRERGPAPGPRLGLFELGRQSQQESLLPRAAHELDPNRQPAVALVHRGGVRRLARHVERGGEGAHRDHVGRGLAGVIMDLLEHRARPGWLDGHGRGGQYIEFVPPARHQRPGDPLEVSEGRDQGEAVDGLAGGQSGDVVWLQPGKVHVGVVPEARVDDREEGGERLRRE